MQYIKIAQIKEANKSDMKNWFLAKREELVWFKEHKTKICVAKVANAAPYRLYFCIKNKFKIKLIIAPQKTIQKNLFCLLKTINN